MTKIYTLQVNRLMALTLIFSLCLWQSTVQAQNSTCATAATLAIDNNCVGTSGGTNTGDPTGNDDTDGNVCSANYSDGDDFIFEYTATTTDALELDLTTTNSWSGLLVTEGCPTTGTCFASSTSSGSSESVTTPPMTIGVTYYIHISTWPTPQSTGQFCLNAQLNAPAMPPANDDCAGATPVPVNADLSCTMTASGTIEAATASPEDPAACGGTEDDDVWFSFMATATSHEIDLINLTGGTTDLYHSLWEGTCGSLTHQGLCSDPNSSTATGLTIGNTYYLRVYSWTSTTGQTTDFDVCIGTLPPPPANDACAGAVSISNGANVGGDNSSATDVEGLSVCEDGTVGAACDPGVNDGTLDWSPGMWYVYNSTGAETVTIEVNGFDTELQVFSGACGSLVCVAGDDDSSSAGCCGSQVCFESTASVAPVDYYIYVDGHAGATGAFTLTLVTAPLPVELISFEGTTLKSTNQLNWATATELGTEYFVVERSHTGFDSWREIGRLNANGNSETRLDYQFEDKDPMANSYYRLRTVDYDRSEQKSEVVNLTRKTEGFAITSVFPNPTKDLVTVQYHSVDNSEVTVRVNDIAGRLLTTYKVDANNGFNDLEVQLNNVAPGTYFLSLSNEVNNVVQRIVKQ